MKKRVILTLMVFALVLASAPVAMADHCSTCRYGNCRPATVPAYYSCTSNGVSCTLTGWGCGGPHPFTEESLAAEFVVASVERLDEAQPAQSEQTRVASLETKTPAPDHQR